MAIEIASGSNAGNKLIVDSDGNTAVNMPVTQTQAGYVVPMGEEGVPSSFSTRVAKPMQLSLQDRLRTGTDSILWDDNFAGTVPNSSKYQFTSGATGAVTQSGGFGVLTCSTTSGSYASLNTYRTFRINDGGELELTALVSWAFTNPPMINNISEIGFGFASTTTVPTDGAFFRFTSTGVLQAVTSNNGTEVITNIDPSYLPTALNAVTLQIVLSSYKAVFKINGINVVTRVSPTTSAGVVSAIAQRVFTRTYNTAATSGQQVLRIGGLGVIARDLIYNKQFTYTQAAMGLGGYQSPNGVTPDDTAAYQNSAAPTIITLSNTVPGSTSLGGLYQFAAPAGAVTDYCIAAYQAPIPSATSGNQNLYITDISIQAMVTGTTSATTPTAMIFGMGIGSTAPSLATVDSIVAGTRAPRRLPLGNITIPTGTTSGTTVTQNIAKVFPAPMLIDAGTYFQLICRMNVGTATAGENIVLTVSIGAVWE